MRCDLKHLLFGLLFAALSFLTTHADGSFGFIENISPHKPQLGAIALSSAFDGSFSSLTYQIASTGRREGSGRVYETESITVELDGRKFTIQPNTLMNLTPGPGQTIHSQITFTRDQLLSAVGIGPSHPERARFEALLQNPSNVGVSANVRIIDLITAADGTVTRNPVGSITSAAQCREMLRYGFNQNHVNDCLSRFAGAQGEQSPAPTSGPPPPGNPSSPPPASEPPTPRNTGNPTDPRNPGQDNPNTGVRPTVIVN